MNYEKLKKVTVVANYIIESPCEEVALLKAKDEYRSQYYDKYKKPDNTPFTIRCNKKVRYRHVDESGDFEDVRHYEIDILKRLEDI